MTNEKENLKKAIEELKEDILKGLSFNALKDDKISDFLKLALSYFNRFKDKSFLISLFFKKVGNTTLYNKLNLKAYFMDNSCLIEYNVKKDKLFLIGDFESIKESFKEWKERTRKERKEESEKLTKKEKLIKSYKARFDGLDKESKKILIDLLKA